MFGPIARFFSSGLNFFYSVVPSYGVAIVLLTLAIMLVLTPLTVKSTRSMLAMQRLQPEMKRLQQQHKNDRQALNEAMMAFYKEHNVNPLSGCLPMLLQMPVFFGLYESIRGLTHNPPKFLAHGSKLFKALCPHVGANGHCVSSETGKDLAISLKSFGMDLAKTVSDSHGSFAKALPFYLLIALTTATQYYQQRQLNNRNPSAAAANPQMQMTQKILPLVFLIIYVRIPAAVVLYFLFSNLLRIGQQGAMWRWDPKLKAEVASEVREIDAKTKSIEAKGKQVPNRNKGGKPNAAKATNGGSNGAKASKGDSARSDGNGSGAGRKAGASSGSGGSEGSSGSDSSGGRKTPAQPPASTAGRPNVSKPNRGPQSPRQQRGRRGR